MLCLLQELIAAQAAARELGPDVLRGLELQISTQIGALRSQRARYLQSVNAALTAVGHHKSLTEAKIQELAARAAESARAIAARAPPSAVPPPLTPQTADSANAARAPKHAGAFAGHAAHTPAASHLWGAGSRLAPTPLAPYAALHASTAAAPASALATPPAPPFASEGHLSGASARMSLSAGPALAPMAGGGDRPGGVGAAPAAPDYDPRAWAPAVPRALQM